MENIIEFSKIPHPLIRDGRSQDLRQVAALDPKQAPLDDRSMGDMLNYIYHYAKQIHFYNNENKQDGNWQSFFNLKDPFLIAKISQFDSVGIAKEYRLLSERLLNEPIFDNILPLLDRVFELTSEVDDWSKNLQRDTRLKKTINNVITSNLRYALKEFIGCANVAYAKKWIPSKYETPLNNSSVWNINVADRIHMDAALMSIKGSDVKQLLFAKDKLDELFDTHLKAINQIKSLAPKELQTILDDVESQNHSPHIALLLTFLRLFETTRQDLNLIAQRHLDFFYKKILKLQTKKAKLDQAHLVFELAVNRPNYELKKGTQFSAGEDDLGIEMLFELNEDVVLSQAQIGDLKTLFLNPSKYECKGEGKLDKDDLPLLIEGVYAASVANSSDGLGADFSDKSNASWFALGNEMSKCPKEDEPEENKAMPFAQQGFVLAERVLLLNEGDRLITIRIPIKNSMPVGLKAATDSILEIEYSTNDASIPSTRGVLEKEGLSVGLIDEVDDFVNQFTIDDLFLKLHRDILVTIEDKLILINHVPRKHAFKVFLSGEDGWIEPLDLRVKIDENDLVFDIGLDPTMPAVTFADAEVLGTDYQVDLPLVKIEVDPTVKITDFETAINDELTFCSDASLYQILREAELGEIEITTDVKGVKNFLLQNDESLLDPSKPFLPFGTLPNMGANFFIGSAEIFSKKLKSLDIYFSWDKLPSSFKNHYEMYFDSASIADQIDFQANLELLKAGNWDSIPNGTITGTLFNDVESFLAESSISNVADEGKFFNSGFTGKKLRPYTPESLNGFVKLQLQIEDGFKHNLYGDKLKLQAQAIAGKSNSPVITIEDALYKSGETVTAGLSSGDPHLPKEPYTPTIKEFSVDYTATAKGKDISFFHLYPYESTFKKEDHTITTLLPKFENANSKGIVTEKEGQLFIALTNLTPDSVLHILFQVASSTANPDLDKAELDWYYLRNNEWELLRKDFEVLRDDTNGLINSGIVTLVIPNDINQENTILSSEYHWIKVAAEKNAAAVSEIIGVHTQAAKVYFQNQNNDLARLIQPLPAKSIGELKVNHGAIADFSQPYDSFGGVPTETDAHFYTRVSEHLRHKGRGISLFDYERIVLDAFPELFKVKCIPHTLGRKIQFPNKINTDVDKDRDYELSPGFVTLAVIPDLSNLPIANQLQPKVSLGKLEEIKSFLKERISPFVRLQVLNPRYEAISVRTNVVFVKGRSNAFYEKELKKDILKFLTPWAYNEPGRISFGGKVYRSSILNYVEQREYVDYVFDFEILDEKNRVQNEITARTARTILVSGTHEVTAKDSCDITNEAKIDGQGIGFQRIENEKIPFALSCDDEECDPYPNSKNKINNIN